MKFRKGNELLETRAEIFLEIADITDMSVYDALFLDESEIEEILFKAGWEEID